MMRDLAAAGMAAGVLLCVTVSASAQSNVMPTATGTAAQADQAAGLQADGETSEQEGRNEVTPVIRSAIVSSDGRIAIDGEDDEQIQKMIRAQQERSAQLRKQLADPRQGRQIRAERVRQARAQHPDVVRVLRLDGKAEQQLFAQFAEEMLTRELQPSSFAPARVTRLGDSAQQDRDAAQRYTQRMQKIVRAIGTARLDDFVDYERSLRERTTIEWFDRKLPAGSRLTNEQRDAMVSLLQEHQQRFSSKSATYLAPSASDVSMSLAERRRRDRIIDIVLSEKSTNDTALANRELLERLATVLDAEQLQSFARLKQQELERLRALDRQRRRELGIAADEELESLDDDSARLPPPSTALRLVIRFGVDGEFVEKTLADVRGTPVAVELPKGLLLEIRRLAAPERTAVFEAELFELVRGGRRQVADLGTSHQALGSEYGSVAQLPTRTSVASGRKGYLIEHRIIAAIP